MPSLFPQLHALPLFPHPAPAPTISGSNTYFIAGPITDPPSCDNTGWGDRPSIVVDLGAVYSVSHLVLEGNRNNWRSENIRVGASVDGVAFQTHVGTWVDGAVDLTAGDPVRVNVTLTARFIVLMRDEHSQIRLCRFEAYGTRVSAAPAAPALPLADPPTFSEFNGLGREPFESGQYHLVRARLLETGVRLPDVWGPACVPFFFFFALNAG